MNRPSANVVVFGYGELAVAAIASLEAAGARIAGVVVPGNRSGEDVGLTRAHAEQQGLPVWTQPRASAIGPLVSQLRTLAPDVILTWSYSMVLPPDILAVPRCGAVNVHGGLLPEYRGGHVMQWAILNGEQESGATLHYMDAGLDTGPVIDVRRFPMGADDDAVAFRAKVKTAGAALIEEWWPRIADGTAPRHTQDARRARYWPMRSPADGLIDWSKPGGDICRLVRALACNAPGAFTRAGDDVVSIRRAAVSPRSAERREPGAIAGLGPAGLRVSAGDADVLVIEVEIDGRRLSGDALAEVERLAHGGLSPDAGRTPVSTTHA